MQAIVRNRRQPIRQDREGFLARPANPAPHPNVFVLIIVCLSKPSSVADDRVVLASWASPWKEFQRDYPGSMLTFGSGSAIKSVIDWREAPPPTSLARGRDLLAGAFTLPASQCRTKRITVFNTSTRRVPSQSERLAGIFRLNAPLQNLARHTPTKSVILRPVLERLEVGSEPKKPQLVRTGRPRLPPARPHRAAGTARIGSHDEGHADLTASRG
jgi:hypothetical protein